MAKKRKTSRLTAAQQKEYVMRAGKCMGCGLTDIRLLEVHHIKPLAEGGSHKAWNLSVLCPTCHKKAQRGHLRPRAIGNKPVRKPRSRRVAHVQTASSRHMERKQLARDLAEKVYTPILREAAIGLENNRHTTRIFMEWNRLKGGEPYWTAQVPPGIVEMFESARPSYDRLQSLTPEFQKIVSNVSFQAREKAGLQTPRSGVGMVSFRILQGDAVVRWVHVSNFWESGKRLKELVQEHIKYPDIGFTVDSQIDGQPVGGMGKAYQLADTIFELLEKEPIAIEVRDRTKELRKRAEEIVSRIREELKKG